MVLDIGIENEQSENKINSCWVYREERKFYDVKKVIAKF